MTFRLITDLSFPPGQSVNHCIDPSLCLQINTMVNEVAFQATAVA